MAHKSWEHLTTHRGRLVWRGRKQYIYLTWSHGLLSRLALLASAVCLSLAAWVGCWPRLIEAYGTRHRRSASLPYIVIVTLTSRQEAAPVYDATVDSELYGFFTRSRHWQAQLRVLVGAPSPQRLFSKEKFCHSTIQRYPKELLAGLHSLKPLEVAAQIESRSCW